MKPIIVTATPPTPNGDLHIGHLSGPYLNADVFTRFTRLRGTPALYVSYSDHNQTYLVTTAAKTKEAPTALADRYADAIRETLQMADIDTDTFHNPDARHDRFVSAFFSDLYAKGKLKKKTTAVYLNAATGEHVFEAYMKGYCRVCFSETSGAICEACGHPNDPGSIDAPRNALAPEVPLVEGTLDLVVLELERYREQIRAFYAGKKGQWRPHILELVDELLAQPLADYPITYKSAWGIPAPFPGCEGQVLNVWAEMFPGLINAADLAAKEPAWNGQSEVVQFLGYDNSYFFSFVHLALAFASEGAYAPPSTIVTNEFYELDNYKFSTSKRHVIWGRDLLKDVPTDPVRFFLALSNPEGQKMNFTLNGFKELTGKRLQAPWRELIAGLTRLLESHELAESALAAGSADDGCRGAMARFEHFYSVEHFSLQRAAEHLSQLLVRAGTRVATARQDSRHDAANEVRDLVKLVAWTIPLICAPLMPGFSSKLRQSLGLPAVELWDEEPQGALVVRTSALAGLAPLLDF